MRAVKWTDAEKLEAVEREEQEVPLDGILLETAACGLTDTDLKVLNGTLSSDSGFLGGQIAGVVKKAGERAAGYEEGDRILVSRYLSCGSCRFCRSGRTNLCRNKKTFGLDLPGGLAGEISLDGSQLENVCVTKIPGNLKFEEVCAADVAAAVYHAQQLCGIGPGMKILVLGCGPAGCMHTHLAKLRGADRIIQTDVSASRMEMARPFMADELLNSAQESLSDTVKAVTDGRGADVAIVAADKPEAFGEAIEQVAPGGKILLFSRLDEAGRAVPVDLTKLAEKQVQLVTSDGYTREDIQQIIWLAGKRKVTLKWLVTSVIEPDEWESKKADAAEGRELRIVVHP